MGITIKKLSAQEIERKGISAWPLWEKKTGDFEWYYDVREECFFLEGEVEVETPDGKRARFGKGDYVAFPKGLKCTWHVKKDVRKHYTFGD